MSNRLFGNLRSIKSLFLLLAMTLVASSWGQGQKDSGVFTIGGTNIHYETYGTGEPLLLLHGWTQSSQFWLEYVADYAKHFKVYAIDLHGHGKSSILTKDFSIQKTAQDIFQLIEHLKLKQVNAIGLSFGGLVLLEIAASHPKLLSNMILIGTSNSFKGGDNQKRAITYENLPDSFRNQLKGLHLHGENQIRAMFDPNLNYEINLSASQLALIEIKTMIVQGDRDEITGVEPALFLYRNLPNSELWIVPNTGHIAITDKNKKAFLTKSIGFFASGDSKHE